MVFHDELPYTLLLVRLDHIKDYPVYLVLKHLRHLPVLACLHFVVNQFPEQWMIENFVHYVPLLLHKVGDYPHNILQDLGASVQGMVQMVQKVELHEAEG